MAISLWHKRFHLDCIDGISATSNDFFFTISVLVSHIIVTLRWCLTHLLILSPYVISPSPVQFCYPNCFPPPPTPKPYIPSIGNTFNSTKLSRLLWAEFVKRKKKDRFCFFVFWNFIQCLTMLSLINELHKSIWPFHTFSPWFI